MYDRVFLIKPFQKKKKKKRERVHSALLVERKGCYYLGLMSSSSSS